MGLLFGVSLLLLGGLLGACSGGPGEGGAHTSQIGSVSSAPTTVNVAADEMSFSFETMPTKAGTYTFVIKNQGKIEHTFVIEGNGRDYHTKGIAPGTSESLTVDLAPGQYNFVCSVFGHAIAGMRGSFTLS